MIGYKLLIVNLSVQRKLITACLVSAILSFAPLAALAGVSRFPLEARMAAQMPQKAEWSLVAIDMATGSEIVAAGASLPKALHPASLVKLITAGALLDHAERYGRPAMGTRVLYDGEIAAGTLHGNLYLVGEGNALLATDDLLKAAKTVAGQGIRQVNGSLVADDSFLDPRGLARSRKGPGYAPADALGLELHTMALTVIATEPGKPPEVRITPPNDAVRLAVAARTGAAVDNIKISRLDDAAYSVQGNIAQGKQPLKQRFALEQPALYAAQVLETALKKLDKVQIAGGVIKGRAPDTAKLLARIEPPDLLEVLQDMNVNSLNVVADNLLLILGAAKYGAPGTRDKGLEAVHDFLSELGLPVGEAQIMDGSGLGDDNRLTSRYLAQYLAQVAHRPWFRTFYKTLPRAGFDGTVREGGYKSELFRVKTGRLENVFALAGYGLDAKGREISFAFMVNVTGAAAMNMEQAGAKVMRYLGTEFLQ